MQVPPDRALTLHSDATGGPLGPRSFGLSATKRRGGSQIVIFEEESMPGPNSALMAPPSLSSIVVGTNHDETPRPVAMASQTSSGVPGTSTSASTNRWPVESLFTLMMVPLAQVGVDRDGTRRPGDASDHRRIHG